MTNDPVLALIEKWRSESKRTYKMAHGKSKVDQSILAQSVRFWNCASELESILPQRDQVVAETVERCATEFESDAWVDATGHQVANRIRKLSPDPLFRQRIENAARLEEANWWKHRTVTWGLDKAISTSATEEAERIAELRKLIQEN